uniref:Uncharacterized protein n=1 Tax=Pipistrellus kuhlii TaxID=59472 RepID=A0A7J8A8Y3_PIPKU|nr:hypothetical protein mPipKuh1_009045 [Pipistrellus kuhlii]
MVRSEIRSRFSPTPSEKATWPEPRKHFQENKCEKGGPGSLSSPAPRAALPGLASQPRAWRTDGQPLWEYPCLLPLGTQKNFSVFGGYLRNSSERKKKKEKKMCFPSWRVGLKRDPCLPGSGRTQAPGKVRLPEAATLPGTQLHVQNHGHSRPLGPRGAHSEQPPPGGLVLP